MTACSAPPDEMGITLTAADSAFAMILADLHLADAETMLSMDEGAFAPDPARRDSVLDSHGMTDEKYAATVEALTAEPQRLMAIYNRALDVASRQQ